MLDFLAGFAANTINPIFILLVLSEPLRQFGPGGERIRRSFPFYVRSALAIGVATLLAELGKRYQVWPGHPGFPSGHMSFAMSSATCLVLQRGRRWAAFTAPLAIAMGASLIYAQWHTPVEVAAACLLGPAVAVMVFRALAPPSVSRAPSAPATGYDKEK